MLLNEILAAGDPGFEERLTWARVATVVTGVGLVAGGVGLLVYKPKNGPPLSPGTKILLRMAGVVAICGGVLIPIFEMAGVGLINAAGWWLASSSAVRLSWRGRRSR